MSDTIVIYHSPCMDGFTAAWACWLAHPDWEFVKGVHGEPPPNVKNKNVFLLDFSYKRYTMMEVIADSLTTTILDHHVSAQKDLDGLDKDVLNSENCHIVFDMTKSGAMLAWEFFHHHKPAPALVRYVQDRDLWKFVLPDSRSVSAALFSYEYSFEQWNELLARLDGTRYYSTVSDGIAIERKHQKDIAELLAICAHPFTLAGYEVKIANLPYTMASDGAHQLANGAPFGATYYIDKNGFYQFSLRSTDKGVDVSEIAKKYGGGGHKHAAGFRLDGNMDMLSDGEV